MREKQIYPHIEGADQRLRELAFKDFDTKFAGPERKEALALVERELKSIESQGAASGYLIVYDAFKSAGVTADDVAFRGTMAASLVSYLLDFIAFNPLTCEPKLYPEYCFGKDGKKGVCFDFNLNPGFFEGVSDYFNILECGEPVSYQAPSL